MVKSQLDIDSLEQEIDKIINAFQQLTIENSSLRKKIDSLNHEYTNLLDNKKQAIKHLKEVIAKIQDELLCKTQT